MSYEKQNLVDGQILTAAHLNHIEDGIAQIANQNLISPTLKTQKTATGVDITITDVNGEKTVSLKNGVKGDTGPAGPWMPRGPASPLSPFTPWIP